MFIEWIEACCHVYSGTEVYNPSVLTSLRDQISLSYNKSKNFKQEIEKSML